MITEADTGRKYVLPKLYDADWTNDQISEQKYFTPATQIAMTATPLRNDNVDTYRYFGDPFYIYSLAQGIEDGFLAPYRVRRIATDVDAIGWKPDPGLLDRFGREVPDGLYETRDFERLVSLLGRTEAVARHLTDYLLKTNRHDKTIVFCVDQEHAADMRKALNNLNADITPNHHQTTNSPIYQCTNLLMYYTSPTCFSTLKGSKASLRPSPM